MPVCTCRKLSPGRSCPKAANASKTVDSPPVPSVRVSGGRDQLAAHAEDRPLLDAVKQLLLVAEREVAERRAPRAAVVREVVRHDGFDHRGGADALLVDDRRGARVPWALIEPAITVSFSGNAFSVIIGRGQIQVAAGPGLLGAETAKVIDDLADLILGQQVLERRHDRGERPCRAAVGDDGAPLDVRLRGGGRAVAEIRKRGRPLEAREVLRLSPSRPARGTPRSRCRRSVCRSRASACWPRPAERMSLAPSALRPARRTSQWNRPSTIAPSGSASHRGPGERRRALSSVCRTRILRDPRQTHDGRPRR